MKVTFANGETKMCNFPTEQKLFSQGKQFGWMLILTVNDSMTSKEVDEFFTSNNINKMTFTTDDDGPVCEIVGYTNITSAIIRHSDSTTIEVQMKKVNEEE